MGCSEGFFAIESKISDDSVDIENLEILVAFFISLTSERNFRSVINDTPVVHFILHAMAELNKLTSQMFGGHSHTDTGRMSVIGDVFFCEVLVLIVVKVGQCYVRAEIVERLHSLLIKGLHDNWKVSHFAFFFCV